MRMFSAVFCKGKKVVQLFLIAGEVENCVNVDIEAMNASFTMPLGWKTQQEIA